MFSPFFFDCSWDCCVTIYNDDDDVDVDGNRTLHTDVRAFFFCLPHLHYFSSNYVQNEMMHFRDSYFGFIVTIFTQRQWVVRVYRYFQMVLLWFVFQIKFNGRNVSTIRVFSIIFNFYRRAEIPYLLAMISFSIYIT